MSDSHRTVIEAPTWHDGTLFFTKRWLAADTQRPPKALVIFLHGFAEHVERYDHFWPRFAEQCIEVIGFDGRGFGRSGPRYGDTTLEQQIEDTKFAIRKERARLDDAGLKTPIFLYGHSMGGGVLLHLCTRPQTKHDGRLPVTDLIAGVICSAPWILRSKASAHLPQYRWSRFTDAPQPPPAPILWALPWLAWAWPDMPFKKTLNAQHATSDKVRIESFHNDPLCRGDTYLKTVAGLLLAGYELLDQGWKDWPRDLPLLISHGVDDPSTSPRASQQFLELVETKDKECKLWPGMLHEGHNERDELRIPFLAYILSWIQVRAQIDQLC